jgi:hypothetical protein
MGIIAIVLGVIGLLISWIPFLGLVAIPIAAIGGLLGLIGLVLAAVKKFKGWSMPLLGCLICTGTIVVSLTSTGATSAAIGEVVEEANKANQTKRAAEEAAEADYIANNLTVANVEAAFRKSPLDGNVPGVSFSIKNDGDQTLKRIRVKCSFLNAAGKRIAEESYLPVSEYDFGSGKPLKPGYVWTLDNGRFYSAKGIPAEWAPGRVEIKITEIDFQ